MTAHTAPTTTANYRMLSVRERFGGIDTPASLMGMFAALGVLVFVGALVGAGATGIAYQLNLIDAEGQVQELLLGGAILAVVVVFVAFFLGGWAAARMARYDGAINGVATALWLLLIVAVSAALGAWIDPDLNAFQAAGLPDWFSQIRGDDVTTGAFITAAAATLATLLGGWLGGSVGERYHQRADASLVAGDTVVVDHHPVDDTLP